MPRWPNISKYCGDYFRRRGCGSVIERAKLSPSIGICATPAISAGDADADQVEQGRRQIAGMDELVAHLALGRDPLRPGHDEGIADAAAMGVLLVAPQRRVRRHRPAMREIGVGIRPADVVDPPQLFRHRLGTEIVRPHRVDEAERPALLARAIVGHHEDQRVVADAGLVEETRSAAPDAGRHDRACRQRPPAAA